MYSVVIVFLLLAFVIPEKEKTYTTADFPFFVGTYTNSKSEGIYKYVLRKDGTLKSLGLAAKLDNPSFLAKSADNKFLVAVSEISNTDGIGFLKSYAIRGDSLQFINTKSSAGKHPCFVTINKMGYVVTANYSDGTVALLKMNATGELSDPLDLQQHTGKGTSQRQKGPHAHSAWFASNAIDLISVDLGTNELWFSQIDTLTNKLVPKNPSTLAMTAGAGPRHMTFHPNGKWAYVLNELSSTTTLLEKNALGNYTIVSSISTLPTEYKDPNSCADIHISTDGRFVYASNRGHNSIVIYKVKAEDGTLTLVGHEATRGRVPRNFSLSPDGNYLLVANQETNTIVSFRRNTKTGSLTFIDKIAAPTPVCILF
ncbi:MAG: lactonase family protein [Flavobacteriaceae bacterium]